MNDQDFVTLTLNASFAAKNGGLSGDQTLTHAEIVRLCGLAQRGLESCLQSGQQERRTVIMTPQLALHVLRNPYGHSDELVRNARLWAADRIEAAERHQVVRNVPEGWKLVPAKPTEEMLYALGNLRRMGQWAWQNSEAWEAMLAAAPECHVAGNKPNGGEA